MVGFGVYTGVRNFKANPRIKIEDVCTQQWVWALLFEDGVQRIRRLAPEHRKKKLAPFFYALSGESVVVSYTWYT